MEEGLGVPLAAMTAAGGPAHQCQARLQRVMADSNRAPCCADISPCGRERMIPHCTVSAADLQVSPPTCAD